MLLYHHIPTNQVCLQCGVPQWKVKIAPMGNNASSIEEQLVLPFGIHLSITMVIDTEIDIDIPLYLTLICLYSS